MKYWGDCLFGIRYFVQIRFAALNESDDSGEEESDREDEPTTTKEAEVCGISTGVVKNGMVMAHW